MNKKSQYTKIFSQAILDLKDNGRLDIFHGRRSSQNDQLCDLLPRDEEGKKLGFKKLAFLFVVLLSGIFMSIFVVLLEFLAKMILEKEKPTIENIEINQAHEECLDRSVEEGEKCGMPQDVPKSRIPISVDKTNGTFLKKSSAN